MKRFILTGTPGSGKTSVICELERRGYGVVHEAATDLIALEQNLGIEKPWEQPSFVDQIIQMQRERQESSQALNPKGGVIFFDRSPFCTYALGKYLAHSQGSEFKPAHRLLEENDRCQRDAIYQNKVFFFENLGFIEHTDARQISYEEALIFEQIHLDVYGQFGCEIQMVPKTLSIPERCDFILQHIGDMR